MCSPDLAFDRLRIPAKRRFERNEVSPHESMKIVSGREIRSLFQQWKSSLENLFIFIRKIAMLSIN